MRDRPDGHCSDDEAWAEFVGQNAGRTRADLAHGKLTDFELANRVYLASRHDLDLLSWHTAAKERIRWLSIRLAEALGDSNA